MGTLKVEMLQNDHFINAADACTEVFAFIDGYYKTPITSRAILLSQTKPLFGP